MAYKEWTEEHFNSRDPAHVWEGIWIITSQTSSRDPLTGTSVSLAGELNNFFACLEKAQDNNMNSPQLDLADHCTGT